MYFIIACPSTKRDRCCLDAHLNNPAGTRRDGRRSDGDGDFPNRVSKPPASNHIRIRGFKRAKNVYSGGQSKSIHRLGYHEIVPNYISESTASPQHPANCHAQCHYSPIRSPSIRTGSTQPQVPSDLSLRSLIAIRLFQKHHTLSIPYSPHWHHGRYDIYSFQKHPGSPQTSHRISRIFLLREAIPTHSTPRIWISNAIEQPTRYSRPPKSHP